MILFLRLRTIQWDNISYHVPCAWLMAVPLHLTKKKQINCIFGFNWIKVLNDIKNGMGCELAVSSFLQCRQKIRTKKQNKTKLI